MKTQDEIGAVTAISSNNNINNSSSSSSSSTSTTTTIYHALLAPQRIQALSDCDKNLLSYDPNSFLMIFQLRGRHFKIIAAPLLALLLWDIAWALLLITFQDTTGHELSQSIQSMEALITPLLVPVSFLLVFRLGRAAVRYWDARAAVGKVVEVCRTTSSTALVGIWNQGSVGGAFASASTKENQHQQQQQQQHQLAEDFVRWIAVFPIAVKNFLRPFEGLHCTRTREIGDVLCQKDRDEFLNAKGTDRYAPILVLNRLRQLAYEASTIQQQQPNSVLGPFLFRQLNEQIDTLTGAWGAMERINGTPLPFVYVVHLRTFLMLYLFLWHMEAIASSGWIALLPLLLASWGLLGVEAASVECERPFQWQSNHLALGKACIVVSSNLTQTMENTGWIQVQAQTTTRAATAGATTKIETRAETAQDRVKMLGTLYPPQSSSSGGVNHTEGSGYEVAAAV